MERLSLSPTETQGINLFVSADDADDHISKLTDDLLLKILSKLSTKEVVRTSVLSKRWTDVWKEISHLLLDMRQIVRPITLFSDDTPYAARSVTKIIRDHRGYLERCTIHHYSYQCQDGMVESWIRSLVHVKHTKHLTLINYIGLFIPNTTSTITLDLPPQSFSHPNLKSLMLGRYNLKSPQGFNNCWNLKNIKLIRVLAEIGVFNAILMSCPSLQVLVLNISCHKKSGPLKIVNRNLKFLSLTCHKIDGIEVTSPSLDILTIGSISLSCAMDKFVVANSRIQFNRNYWATGRIYPHTSYNISCPNQEEKHIAHEFMMSESEKHMKRFASLSVNVDLKNMKEVGMLREVLSAWPQEIAELEIVFKDSDASRKEGESSIGRTQKKFWEEVKPFPNADVRAYVVWLFNFSGSEEEFALASLFIAQGIAVRTMIIKPSSIALLSHKLKIEETITMLKELPKAHKELIIL